MNAPSHQSELKRRFIAAREAAGMTQEQAAQALGLSVASMSRKELGKQPVTVRDVTAMERLADESRRPDMVPRGTALRVSEPPPPPATARRIREFEREAIRLGALDDEVDHIVESLTSGTSKAFYLGEGGEEELEYQIDGLRVWLERRIAKRKRAKRHGS